MRDDQSTPMVSVYSGRQCIGHVVARGTAGFEAFDCDDKSFGIFASMKLAADVLSNESEVAT
jgi:hypothetical protein